MQAWKEAGIFAIAYLILLGLSTLYLETWPHNSKNFHLEAEKTRLAPNVVRTLIIQHLEQKSATNLGTAEDFRKQFHLRHPNHSSILENGCANCVTIENSNGSLGEFMFSVASLMNFALENNKTPVFFGQDHRRTFFQGPFLEIPESHYFNSSRNITAEVHQQFSKYLHNRSANILKVLTFSRNILTQAQSYIIIGMVKIMAKTGGLENCTAAPVLVGVQIRRNELGTEKDKDSLDSYLLHVVSFVERRNVNTIFLVVSDDIGYCKDLFHRMALVNVIFAEDNPPEVDLAILTLMDNMIITFGTFGWWGAYLSGAEKVYYFKALLRKGSRIGNETDIKDYFLPNWIGRF